MKLSTTSLVAGVICLFAVNVNAQQPHVASRANDYSYYEVQPSPSDVEPIAGSIEKSAGKEIIDFYDDACADTCCDEPWRLFPTTSNGISLRGWLDAGITGNTDNPASRYNGPLTFNDRNEGQVNQLYAVLERPIDSSCGWDVGGRVDVMFGTDYIFTQEVGWETDTAGNPKWNNRSHYGLAMPQAYAEVGYNDLSVKVGRFYTIIGYEVVTAPGNFFYSHAYTMQYGEPFTHTGALATWNATDSVTVNAGAVNGWDRFDGVMDRFGFLGGGSYQGDRGSVTFQLIADQAPNTMNVYTNRTMYSLVFAYDLSDRWSYVLQHDNGYQENGIAAGQHTEWYGINQYLFYDFNDCWRFGGRFEWFRDDDGVRVAGVRAGNPYAGGSDGNFYAVTLGANWSPCANFRLRPEVRWDWFSGNGPRPYNGESEMLTAAMDAIIMF